MKSGFVALIGRSNVGKSTLMNTLVGTKIAAVSFRPQMTRHVIHGVLNSSAGQAVFVDTPGILKEKRSVLTGKLLQKVKEAIADIDLLVYVVDPSREIGPEERFAFGMIRHLPTKKILVMNKSDLPARERPYKEDYEAWSKEFDAVFSLSALRAAHIQPLKEKVMELLPEGQPMYEKEQLTNIDNYFWIAEIVREKLFSVLEKEVPYSATVEIDEVDDKPDVMVVKGRILTSDTRYKKMIIGVKGHKIKEIGTMARRELEAAVNKKIFLELTVEVDAHWMERV
jgi:GTP-binding protein Era